MQFKPRFDNDEHAANWYIVMNQTVGCNYYLIRSNDSLVTQRHNGASTIIFNNNNNNILSQQVAATTITNNVVVVTLLT